MKHVVLTILLCVSLSGQAVAEPIEPVSLLVQEPFYSSIVADATRLRAETETFAARPSLQWLKSLHFRNYAEAITELAARDMKGHDDLKARGTDSQRATKMPQIAPTSLPNISGTINEG